MDWTKDAPCRGKTDLFYSVRQADILEAKQTCVKCPFLGKECTSLVSEYERDLGAKARYGIADGMDPSERAQRVRANRGKRQDRDKPVSKCPHCSFAGHKKAVQMHLSLQYEKGCMECLRPRCAIPTPDYMGRVLCDKCHGIVKAS